MAGTPSEVTTKPDDDGGQPSLPYGTRVGRTGVALVSFENVTFYFRPNNILGVTVADFLGRGPESRFDRASITAVRADPAGRCFDGSPARSLTLHVAGRPPIILLQRAPADATLLTVGHLCQRLGLPMPADYTEPKPLPPEPSPPRPDPLARRRRAERWLNDAPAAGVEEDTNPAAALHALPPLLPTDGHPAPVMEYATESTDDHLVIYRAPGALRIIVPASGWPAFATTPGVIGAAVILAVVVGALTQFPFANFQPQLIPALFVLGLFAAASVLYTLLVALDAYSDLRIDVNATELMILARRGHSGQVVERARFNCETVRDVLVRRSIARRFCRVVVKVDVGPALAVTGPITERQAHAITARLRPAVGLLSAAEPLQR